MSLLDHYDTPTVVDAPAKSWELGYSSIGFSEPYAASNWVHLFHPPTEFSFDEALLLCRQDEDSWVAWIPNFGEIILKETEFVPLSSS
jgi:hypothetical protein